MVVADLGIIEIDLLHQDASALEATPMGKAKRLAAQKLAEQIQKGGLPSSCLREATLSIAKSPGRRKQSVNGPTRSGYDVSFVARAVSDLGKIYESKTSIFAAPHNPLMERQSNRRC